MKLIVGLGNPGSAYEGSRHNIGFSVTKALGKSYKSRFKKGFLNSSHTAKISINASRVVLAMPQTFMNNSGAAVSRLLRRYKVDLSDLLVICDDLDLEFGIMRLRAAGSSGGHRGLNSIIEHLGSEDFARLRLGIGRSKGVDAADYVLSKFNSEEKEQLAEVVERATLCVKSWLQKGITETMNTFNKQRSR